MEPGWKLRALFLHLLERPMDCAGRRVWNRPGSGFLRLRDRRFDDGQRLRRGEGMGENIGRVDELLLKKRELDSGNSSLAQRRADSSNEKYGTGHRARSIIEIGRG